MEHNSEKYVMTFDKTEVSKCLLCFDPPCSKACPQHADIGSILESLYFRNYIGAAGKLNCDCTYCNAPCEKACVQNGLRLPVEIREIFLQLKKDASILPESRIDQVDLSTDICGIKLENPFLLSSSVVASSYDMCKRAFEAGWAGASLQGFQRPARTAYPAGDDGRRRRGGIWRPLLCPDGAEFLYQT